MLVRVQLIIGGYGKVIWGHMRSQFVFSPISSDTMEIETRKLPKELARQDASKDKHIDLLGSWPELDLAWPEIKFWNGPSRSKSLVSNGLDETDTMVPWISFVYLYEVISYTRKLGNFYHKKRPFFPLMTLNLNPFTLAQIWWSFLVDRVMD